ncbi:ImmA/IrrE family metallo-endopeptidase [Rhodococcus rhodochrous]|uniref:ImmA/IrrE family metallo-endopeptidase n=1 Tax=Rhodococcus rhodochrous TaxID=1829 RepID=UPI0036F289C4
MICVNAADTINGQIFTIVHEIAHVWRGASGVSDGPIVHDTESELERWCNAVASETLVPARDLRQQLHRKLTEDTLTGTLDELANRYHCGTLVVLLQLKRIRALALSDFDAAYTSERARLNRLAAQAPPSSGGGNFYANQRYRVGGRLSRAIIADTAEGTTSIAEAMRLTSIKSLSTFDKFAKQMVGA